MNINNHRDDPKDLIKLSEELEEFKIELEMQNDELIRTKEKIELESIINNFSPISFVTIDSDGIITDLNNKAKIDLGFDKVQSIGVSFSKYVASESQDAFHYYLNDIKSKSGVQKIELYLNLPIKGKTFVELNSTYFVLRNIEAPIIRTAILERTQSSEYNKELDNYKKHFELFKRLPDPIFVHSQGIIKYINQSFERLFITNSKQVVGKKVNEILLSKDKIGDEKLSYNLLQNKDGIFEIDVSLNNKLSFYLQINSSNAEINGEKLTISTIRDLTKLKEINQNNKILSQVIEQIPISVLITDKKGKTTYVNPVFTEITGYTKDEVIGKNPKILKSETFPNKYFKEMWETVLAGKIWNGEFENKDKFGNLFWEQAYISPIYDENGEITRLVAVKELITEKKKALDAIKKREERYRSAINNSLETFFIAIPVYDNYDKIIDFKIDDINTTGIELLAKDRKEIVNKNVSFIFPEKYSEMIIENCRKVFLSSEAIRKEYYLSSSDIGLEWILATVVTLQDGVAMTIRDISEQKRAEAALKESEKHYRETNIAKDKFFSIISHDLKSPISSFNQLTEILDDNYEMFEDAEKKELIKNMKSSSQNLYALVEKLLEWSRLQVGKIPYNPESLNLKFLVDSTLEIYADKARNKKIDLINKISILPTAKGDEYMISTVLRNLISNALKFTNANGFVSIDAAIIKDRIEVVVEDNGIGIKEENLGKLFKIDENFSSHGTDNEKGTGLGLNLCKEFMEIHGGSIRVESKYGVGSKFYFDLEIYK